MSVLQRLSHVFTSRTFFIVVAAAALMGVGNISQSAVVLRGDADLNGTVSIGDATRVLRYAVKITIPTPDQLLASDVSPVPGKNGRTIGDGEVKVDDAIRILRRLVNLVSAAEFYAGEASTIDTSVLSLRFNTLKTHVDLYNQPAGTEVPLSLVVTGADKVSLGGATFTITPQAGAPAVSVVRVEAGGLLTAAGTEAVVLPTAPLAAGVTTARGAFSVGSAAPISGTGEVLRFILKASATVPTTAKYDLALTLPDFANETADNLQATITNRTLTNLE